MAATRGGISRQHDDEYLILFGHPRSGSTSLYRILQTHPRLNILDEPFNPDFSSWDPANKNYSELAQDVPSLDAQLAEIFVSYNGIKVLCYQLAEKLELHLLRRADCRIVLLRRTNVLQAVVSNFIARQTQVWKMADAKQPLEQYYSQLTPIAFNELETDLDLLNSYMDRVESVVDSLPAERVVKLTYESLYLVEHAARVRQIDSLWGALGLPLLDPAAYDEFLNPTHAKLNPERMYSYLPNADEIDAVFGCDETGWLRPNAVSAG